jgi:hypothetical protein
VYFDYQVTPGPSRRTRDAERVSDPDATHEGNLAVDEHELPMITEEVVQALSQVHDVVHAKLDASVGQPTAIRL